MQHHQELYHESAYAARCENPSDSFQRLSWLQRHAGAGCRGASYYEWTSDPSLPEVVRNFNSNKLTALVNDTTTFHLYGRDLFGCSNVAEMTVSPPPVSIDFAVDPQWIEQSNPTITFRGSSPVEADWWWTPMKDADEVGDASSAISMT